jgi:hypothetical protein
MQTYGVQVLGSVLVSLVIGEGVMQVFKRKGRAIVGLLAVLCSSIGIIGALLALEVAMNLQKSLPALESSLLSPLDRALFLIFMPGMLAAAAGLNLALRFEEFRSS